MGEGKKKTPSAGKETRGDTENGRSKVSEPQIESKEKERVTDSSLAPSGRPRGRRRWPSTE